MGASVLSRENVEKEKNRVKELVSDISHQTKTPMANIRLYTELLKEKLAPWMEGKLTTVYSCPEYLEFVDYRSGKGSAVKYICDLYNVPTTEAYAAGDADNDLSMLAAVGNSISMINGTDEVKAITSITTKEDNNHDGLAEILFSLAKD